MDSENTKFPDLYKELLKRIDDIETPEVPNFEPWYVKEEELERRLREKDVHQFVSNAETFLELRYSGAIVHDIQSPRQHFCTVAGNYDSRNWPVGEKFDQYKTRAPAEYGKTMESIRLAMQFGLKI